MRKSVILVILDGWGIGRKDESNPVHVAGPKTFKKLEKEYPVTSLQASGISVGLPWGETGNSEVGHLTLGAGKVIYQYFPKITMAIRDKSFFSNPALKAAFAHAKKNGSSVNFLGLLTKANVHASLDHLQALLKMAEREGVEVKLHLFADGKDSSPKTIYEFLKEIPREKLATISGRYYAMDRKQSWQLTQAAYDNIVGRGGTVREDIEAAIEEAYRRELSEEFLPPLRLPGENKAVKDNDAVIFFNFREDSIRQLAEAFILENFSHFPTNKPENLYIATLTHYEDKLKVPVAFPADKVENTLGKAISDGGLTQLRVAETYKYAHVTYFFNGYREQPYKNEYRALIPSITAPRADEHPELRASAITDRLLEAAQTQAFDFVLVNYANPDTIGHTANYEAGVAAVRVMDQELDRLLTAAVNERTTVLITSDHGNIEEMLSPTTFTRESQHDPNPVPFHLVSPEFKGKKFLNWKNLSGETMGSLADVAPTVLEVMGLEKPEEMKGRSLLEGLI